MSNHDLISSMNDFIPSYAIYRDWIALKKLSSKPVIKLCSNESPLGTNPNVMQALLPCFEDIALYPDPESTELKTRLSILHNVLPDMLAIGNGSTELIDLIIREKINPGDTTLIPEYSYPLYQILVTHCRGNAMMIRTHQWEYDLNAIIEAISVDTRLIFLANPNNPTGVWINIDAIESFMRQIPTDITVVIDEAYYDFLESTPCYASAIPLVKKYPHLIVTRTFSKAYGLAGLRVGYAVAQAELIQKITKRKQSSNVNLFAQKAAVIACEDDAYKKSILMTVEKNRTYLTTHLNKLGIDYLSSQTNFLLITLHEAAQLTYSKLRQHRILVQPMDRYHLPSHIRVSIGKQEDLHDFIVALQKEMPWI